MYNIAKALLWTNVLIITFSIIIYMWCLHRDPFAIIDVMNPTKPISKRDIPFFVIGIQSTIGFSNLVPGSDLMRFFTSLQMLSLIVVNGLVIMYTSLSTNPHVNHSK